MIFVGLILSVALVLVMLQFYFLCLREFMWDFEFNGYFSQNLQTVPTWEHPHKGRSPGLYFDILKGIAILATGQWGQPIKFAGKIRPLNWPDFVSLKIICEEGSGPT